MIRQNIIKEKNFKTVFLFGQKLKIPISQNNKSVENDENKKDLLLNESNGIKKEKFNNIDIKQNLSNKRKVENIEKSDKINKIDKNENENKTNTNNKRKKIQKKLNNIFEHKMSNKLYNELVSLEYLLSSEEI